MLEAACRLADEQKEREALELLGSTRFSPLGETDLETIIRTCLVSRLTSKLSEGASTDRAAEGSLPGGILWESANHHDEYRAALQLPTLSALRAILAESIAALLPPSGELTILDIGVGNGICEIEILKKLRSRFPELQLKIRFIGVDIVDNSKSIAGDIEKTASDLAITAGYTPIIVGMEELASSRWAAVPRDGKMVAFSSIALHHSRAECRDGILLSLREELGCPFVLVEGNLNHFPTSLEERFRSSWQHFSNTWDLFDSLTISGADRERLKRFCGEELEDVFAAAEDHRTEKEELLEAWEKRLLKCGYSLLLPSYEGNRSFEGGVLVAEQGQWLNVTRKGTVLFGATVCIPSK